MPHLDAAALDTDPQGLETLAEVLRGDGPKLVRKPAWSAAPQPAPLSPDVAVEIERRPDLSARRDRPLLRAG